MQITIVGTGNMARGIATRALAGGHTVTITAKDPRKAVELVDELGNPSRRPASPPTSTWRLRSSPRTSPSTTPERRI